jgi:hypothetical protein
MEGTSQLGEIRWEKITHSLDLLFDGMDEIKKLQQQMQANMDLNTKAIDQLMKDQDFMAQKMEETGRAVAALRLERMVDEELGNTSEDSTSPPHQYRPQQYNDRPHHKGEPPPNRSTYGPNKTHGDKSQDPRVTLPKMQFPVFVGDNPKIWRDKCEDYFRIFNIPEHKWITAATMHMENNVAKWVQVQKRKHGLGTWEQFMAAVEQKFGAYDYIHALNELLELRQVNSVEEYATAFENLQFQVEMHNSGYDTMFFVTQFTRGLKPEISAAVQSQLPDTMERVVMLAKVQQQLQEKLKYKPVRSYQPPKHLDQQAYQRPDNKQLTLPVTLSKESQFRDYCKANNLCYYCTEPFDPSHMAKCTKRQRAQLNALALNTLDVELTEELLEQLPWRIHLLLSLELYLSMLYLALMKGRPLRSGHYSRTKSY